jgi:uncharacterized protein (DUF433 family)
MPAKKQATASELAKQMGQYIVADPKICHGKPTFRGTRIMVDNVLEMVAEGTPWDDIVYEWDGKVPREAIAEAVKMAREVFRLHAARKIQRKAS